MWRILAGLIAQGISFGLGTVMISTHNVGQFLALGVLILIISISGFSVLLDGIKSYFLGDITAELKKLNAEKPAASPPAGNGAPPDPAARKSAADQTPIDRRV